MPLQIVPALAAAVFARFTSFGIACLVGILIGVGESLLFYASTLSWFPKDNGNPLPGMQALLSSSSSSSSGSTCAGRAYRRAAS